MGFLLTQSDFTHGELDRRLFSRFDLAVYNKSAQQLRNVVVIPQGGARRRFGSVFVKAITQNTDRYMLTEFQFNAAISYLFLLEPGSLTIFLNDVQVEQITIGIPWTGEQLINRTIIFTQKHNLMIITNTDFVPVIISFDGVTWSVENAVFRNKPTAPFTDVDYDSINFLLDATTIGNARILTADAAIFTSEFIGGTFEAVGPPENLARIGVARITAFTDDQTVTVDILSTFDDSLKTGTGAKGSNVLLEIPAFSDIRGWPVCSAFYESRLWFGGTRNLPSFLVASVINDFFNFDTGTGLDDEAMQVSVEAHVIKYLEGDRSLQVFTAKDEFAAPQDDERSLTPSNISIRKQTNNGVENVRPIILDNQTFYVARGGKRIMSFVYENSAVSYQSTDISILSSHLIQNPIDAASLKGSTTDDANYLMLVNDDGTLAVYQSLLLENVSAWTLSTLEDNVREGRYRRITEVGEDVYAIIERVDATLSLLTEVLEEPILTENGEEILAEEGSVHELIRFSFDAFTDSASLKSFATPTTVITGLEHLNDKTVQIRGEVVAGDGFFVFPEEVVLNGQITLDDGVVTAEVGLGFTPIIQPMPVQLASSAGQTAYIKKRLIRYFIDFYESLGVLIDGTLIPYLNFGGDVLDEPPTVKTDLIEFPNLGGWDPRQAPILTQNNPLPMTILGIGYEVEV